MYNLWLHLCWFVAKEREGASLRPDSDVVLFMNLIRCIKFGAWKFDVWTRPYCWSSNWRSSYKIKSITLYFHDISYFIFCRTARCNCFCIVNQFRLWARQKTCSNYDNINHCFIHCFVPWGINVANLKGRDSVSKILSTTFHLFSSKLLI